ncbi:hypothetical protein Tco_0634771 [Tanacetum coccineum]
MSDSEHSTVTYTSISSDDGSLDVGSPKVIVYRYDGLPMMLEDPYAYVEAAMQEPPPPDFVPEHVYPEFMPPEDDVLPAEEQPLPDAISPTTDSPGYITESDPEEDPEEDDEDPEEDPADYPVDKDDEEEESLGDDADDKEENEGEDEEEEEEHLALADSVLPPQTGTRGARITVRPQPPMAAYTKALIAAVAATLPLPSPLTSYSSPLPQIPSPPLPVSSPLPMSPPPLPISPTHPLGYRAESPSNFHPLPLPPPIVLPRNKASMVMMRDAAPSTYCLAPPLETPPLLPILLPTSSLPLLLPSTD